MAVCFADSLKKSKDDPLAPAKLNLEEHRKKMKVPASDAQKILEQLGVKDGNINNVKSEGVIDSAKQFFDMYKDTEGNVNYDNPAFGNISNELEDNFVTGLRKTFAPVYYVLSKGGPSSKKLADKLLDYDVTYTKDKAFSDEIIFQINKVLGKDINNLELLEPEMRTQKGRPLTSEQRNAIKAFDLINKKTNKLWKASDVGFTKLDKFTQKHIIARDYHKKMTDYYWERTKQEVKAKSSKFEYEEWLKKYDEKYIKNYMTRSVSREVLMQIQKNGTNSPIIVKIANKKLKQVATKEANAKYNKKDNPLEWQKTYDETLSDVDVLNKIKGEALDIMTYNPARVVNVYFKKRGILLDYETEVTNVFGKKRMVKTYESDYKSVMDRYSTVSSKFISTTKYFPEFTNFGKTFGITSDSKALLANIAAKGNKSGVYISKHLDDLLGLGLTRETNSLTNFLSITSTLSAAAGLSSPTSGVKNLLIAIPRSVGTFGVINTSRAIVRLMTNYGDLMDDGRRNGFLTYQTKTLALQDKAVKLPFNLGEFSMEKLFDLNWMTKTEGWGRVSQVQAGLMTFEIQLDKIHGVKNMLFKSKNKQIKYFWKNVFKLSDDEIDFLVDKNNYRKIQNGLLDKDMTGKMDYIRAKISHYSHVSTSGGTGAQLLPRWMSNPVAKPLSLFYRMAYSTTFDMYQNHLKPIVKHQNVAPLARATVANGLSGYALWQMYDFLFDVKNPVENEDNLTKILSYLWRAEWLQLGSDLLNPHTANIYSDKKINLSLDDEKLATQFNPVYGTAVFRNIASTFGLFMNGFLPQLGIGEKKKFIGQAMDDYLSNTVVIYSQFRKGFNIPDPFKGVPFQKNKLFKETKKFRTWANRWRGENGYNTDNSYYGAGNTNTPYYRNLRNAFYSNDQKLFNRAYWSTYNYIFTSMLKEFRKDGKGMSLRQIHNETMRDLNAHLNKYSVTSLSTAVDKDKGNIIPEREFLNYLKDPKLVKEYKQVKKEFEYRKRILLSNATSKSNKLKYSAIFEKF